jgi:hypothetical protein
MQRSKEESSSISSLTKNEKFWTGGRRWLPGKARWLKPDHQEGAEHKDMLRISACDLPSPILLEFVSLRPQLTANPRMLNWRAGGLHYCTYRPGQVLFVLKDLLPHLTVVWQDLDSRPSRQMAEVFLKMLKL